MRGIRTKRDLSGPMALVPRDLFWHKGCTGAIEGALQRVEACPLSQSKGLSA